MDNLEQQALTRTFMAEVIRREDFADSQREIAGTNGNRMFRFMSEEHSPRQIELDKKNRERQRTINMLLDMGNEAAYRKLFQETEDLLRKYERIAEQVLRETLDQIAQTKEAIAESLRSANKLPDGTAIFLDTEDGQVKTLEGVVVSDDQLASVLWDDNAPTLQDHLQLVESQRISERQIEEIEAYQVNVLGTIRHEMSSEDSDITSENLENFQDRMKESAPLIIAKRAETDAPTVSATSPTHSAKPIF